MVYPEQLDHRAHPGELGAVTLVLGFDEVVIFRQLGVNARQRFLRPLAVLVVFPGLIHRQGDKHRPDQENDLEGAKSLLAKATRLMFEAARIAENGNGRRKKQQQAFDSQLASVDALLKAYERIVTEKQVDPQRVGETRAFINAKVDEAKSLRQAQKLEQARGVLDEAYLSAKIAIEQLRGGDTLVRHLNFASEEEEYDYELDRNDTHRMLVDILLREKLSNAKAGMGKLVEKFMDKAAGLRLQAEEQASGGDYGTAIKTLESSTKEIVRAIRSAGVYIPG